MNTHYLATQAFSQCLTAATQYCTKLVMAIRNVKNALRRDLAPSLPGHEQMLTQALNEAEALAWETPYPHLLFPTLAEEKAQALRRWAFHQGTVWRSSPNPAAAV